MSRAMPKSATFTVNDSSSLEEGFVTNVIILHICLHTLNIYIYIYIQKWTDCLPTNMQLRAARSLWTNFLFARYSIPLATWSPKPIRSFTVGFWTWRIKKNVTYEHKSVQIIKVLVCCGRAFEPSHSKEQKKQDKQYFVFSNYLTSKKISLFCKAISVNINVGS